MLNLLYEIVNKLATEQLTKYDEASGDNDDGFGGGDGDDEDNGNDDDDFGVDDDDADVVDASV